MAPFKMDGAAHDERGSPSERSWIGARGAATGWSGRRRWPRPMGGRQDSTGGHARIRGNGSPNVAAVSDESLQETVELSVGTDVGTIEIILARLRSDGIPVTVEPDLSSLSAVDEEGFRLMVRAEDVLAVIPVLQAADIDTTGIDTAGFDTAE